MRSIRIRYIVSIFGMVGLTERIAAISKTAIYGNVIGSISLIVGIYGVYVSKKTLKTAKQVEEDIKRAKTIAVDQQRFLDNKQRYISFLEKKREIVSNNQIVTYADCNEIILILGDIEGYQTILFQQDMDNVKLQKQSVQNLITSKQYNGNDEKDVLSLIEAITEVLNILRRGEYCV